VQRKRKHLRRTRRGNGSENETSLVYIKRHTEGLILILINCLTRRAVVGGEKDISLAERIVRMLLIPLQPRGRPLFTSLSERIASTRLVQVNYSLITCYKGHAVKQ